MNAEEQVRERKRFLSAVQPAADQQDYAALIQICEPYKTYSDPIIAREALRLLSTAHYETGRFREAYIELRQLAVPDCQDGVIWFQMMLCALKVNAGTEARTAYQNALRYQDPAKFPAWPSKPLIHFYYLKGLIDARDYSEALNQLDLVKATFISARTVDPLTLKSRGIPQFEAFLAEVLALHRALSAHPLLVFNTEDWLIQLARQVSADGHTQVRQLMVTLGFTPPVDPPPVPSHWQI